MSSEVTPDEDELLASWQWVRTPGTHAQLARFVSAAAVRDMKLIVSREPGEEDVLVARKLYRLLSDQGIGYSAEPHLARAGTQQIRDPWLLMRNRVGTCIDFATLYAAMCLEAAARPLLAITEDHAFVVIAAERMLAEPHPRAPLELDGFFRAEEEPAGVLAGTGSALIAGLSSGDLIAIDSVWARAGGQSFRDAMTSALAKALGELKLVDVLYLQHLPEFQALEVPHGHRPIHRYVPEDDTPFIVYESHRAVLKRLESSSGVVALIGPPGQGKSRLARELARKARIGGAWFLDASGRQTLIDSLSAVDLAGRTERAGGRASQDREGYAQNARALLAQTSVPWVVVLDNADQDPGEIEYLLPEPLDGQLLLITSTNEAWERVPDVEAIRLPALGEAEITGQQGLNVTPLVELMEGLPLLLQAFRSLMAATGWDAATVAAYAPAAGDEPSPLRGQETLWRALLSAPGFGERELLASGYSAYMPPDHQPGAAFELAISGGAQAARVLAEHGLLSYELALGGERLTLRLHRTFGKVIRGHLESESPESSDEIVRRLDSQPDLRELLDEHGDLETITRLADHLERIDEASGESDLALGVALHGVAGLLELHGQTRQSGSVFARAERHLGDDRHRKMIADCQQGQARTVNQHHQKDEVLLREAVAWAQNARAILDEEGENSDHCLAMEGLLRWKLASFPGAGETELGLLKEALAIIEQADERRNDPASNVDAAELARSRFNLAGIRIRLARAEPTRAQEHLDRAREIYEDVRLRREEIYQREVHPHIAACVIGVGYVEYFRALLVPADERQRTLWLRAATERALAALTQRSALEGSVDLDEVSKVSAFLVKVMLARAAGPVSAASFQDGVYEEAIGELDRAGIVLKRVPPLPSARQELPDAIGAWARSPALARLVFDFGETLPVEFPTGELLAWLDDFSACWDYRAGTERNLVQAPQLSPVTRKVVLAGAEALGLIGSGAPPKHLDGDGSPARYDDVLILGGLVRACLARPLHAAKLISDGQLEAQTVTALGGFRTIAGDEIGLAAKVIDEEVHDEFHAMDAGVRNAFEIYALNSERGEESEILGASWRVREYSTAGGMAVRVVAAPSMEPGTRRANTPDTYAWFATQLAKLQAGQRVLIVTTEIYVPYQHADALRMLALPYGVEVDMVGANPGKVHPALRQTFLPHQYLQEVRSTIRALRALEQAL